MLKAIISAMVAFMLFVFPVLFYISQTAESQDNNVYVASSQLVAEDNCIVGGDITQVSVIESGTPTSGDNSGGGSGGNNNGGGDNGGSGGNSGGGSDEGNGGGSNGGSGGNGGSDGNGGSGGSNNGGSSGGSGEVPQSNSGGGSSVVSGGSDVVAPGQASGNSTGPVVINEIHPGIGASAKSGNGMVELYNPGNTPVNVNLWYLRNISGDVIGTINDQVIAPFGFLVVDVTGLTGDYQDVTLFDSGDNRRDFVMYTGAGSHNGLCYARIPDGADNWAWTACTLGSSNQQGSS